MLPKICSIPECENKLYARGWCSMHYARWRTHGNPEQVAWEIHKRPADGRCTIAECDRDYSNSGVCAGHYSRRLRKGVEASEAPLANRTNDPDEAFAASIQAGDGCTQWVGWLSPDGYGKFKTGGKSTFAHRYAWERVNGPIPEGMVIDHTCHNTACVNIEHLRLATPTENTRNLAGATANNKHSGARNVGKMGNRWRVRITKDGTTHALGSYDTIEQARAVAESGRTKLFGQFAGKG